MKAYIRLELFAEDVRSYCKLIRGIFDVCAGEAGKQIFDEQLGIPKRSSWVAEITGADEKYGLARNFLRCKIDYTFGNSVGSRGIFAEYILSSGKIYEVKSQISWGTAERYFCTVSEDGDIIKLDEETVCHALGTITKEERAERNQWSIAEITGPDEKYVLARTFLKCSYRYSPNDVDFPYPGFVLQEGKIYEIRYRGKRKDEKTFCKVIDGGIVEISEIEAFHSVGALTYEERREKWRAEKLLRDQRT